MITNMINLPNFKVLDMKQSEHDYRFLVESTALYPSHCPKCGTVANLYDGSLHRSKVCQYRKMISCFFQKHRAFS